MGVGGVRKGYKPLPDPSPDEIAAACERIQSTWTAAERKRRQVGEHQPEATTPVVAIKELG